MLESLQTTSPIEPLEFSGRRFHIKRDDLIDPYFSGNKYWKLYALLHADASHIKRIVSYGGTQSNAMLSIARLCQLRGWEFHYYTKPLSSVLREAVQGNLAQALKLGMKLHEVAHEQWRETVTGLHVPQLDRSVRLIAQGGADPTAQAGVAVLAEAVKRWQESSGIETLNVVTPAGTGTTAYYLARELPECSVITTPAVGDAAYLREQMAALGDLPANLFIIESTKKHRFATPYAEFAALYRELKDAGVEFDLIYAPKMWTALLEHLDGIEGEILYLHSGGVSGNATMLERYRYKGLL